ncbi:hypothetical protein AB0I49_03470 [Streptomyces sp. NPDC050617]|uniref:hypothetical protein n=1 Tax=Streptomyces sp. NPDC050617 TaxID=3154628 RepID=UPI0034453E2B
MTDAQHSTAVRQWPADLGVVPEWTFIDPSAASFSTQLWQDGHPGLVCASNEVADGIRSVSSLLVADRLRVHVSCEGLLGELPGYSWDPKATERGEDAPRGGVDDHSADAVRYAIHSTAHKWRPLLMTAPVQGRFM